MEEIVPVHSVPPWLLTLAALASAAQMHPETVLQMVEAGIIEPVAREGTGMLFDASAVLRLRRADRLRRGLGVNALGAAVILDLVDRLERLLRENEFLRHGR
jgi:chaperone modulatory protein CbpM